LTVSPKSKQEVMMSVVSKFAFAPAWTMAAAVILRLAFAPELARAAPEIGKAAPELVVTELDGQTFDLAKLRGKVVLVSYWATWCAPCRKDMPKLDAFYRRGPQMRPQASVGEAQHGLFCGTGRFGQGHERLHCGWHG
jgi:hypothetical protein